MDNPIAVDVIQTFKDVSCVTLQLLLIHYWCQTLSEMLSTVIRNIDDYDDVDRFWRLKNKDRTYLFDFPFKVIRIITVFHEENNLLITLCIVKQLYYVIMGELRV